MILSLLATVDFTATSPAGGSFILVQVYNRFLFLLLLLLGMAIVALRSSKQTQLDTRPAPWIVRGIVVGAGVFLIHNLIDFSMFEPGPMMVMALLIGSGLGMSSGRTEAAVEQSAGKPWLALAAGVAVWIAVVGALLAPVALAEAYAHEGDDQIRAGTPSLAARSYRAANGRLWFGNSDYAYRAALALLGSGTAPNEAEPLLNAAIAADPMNPQYYRTRAQLKATGASQDLGAAISDYQRVLAIDPNNVQLRLELADLYARAAQRDDAAKAYREALHYNNLLDPAEPKRLSSARVAEINRILGTLGE